MSETLSIYLNYQNPISTSFWSPPRGGFRIGSNTTINPGAPTEVAHAYQPPADPICFKTPLIILSIHRPTTTDNDTAIFYFIDPISLPNRHYRHYQHRLANFRADIITRRKWPKYSTCRCVANEQHRYSMVTEPETYRELLQIWKHYSAEQKSPMTTRRRNKW